VLTIVLMLAGNAVAQPWSWDHGLAEFTVENYATGAFRVHRTEGALGDALHPEAGARGVAAWWGPQDLAGDLLVVVSVFDHTEEAPPEGAPALVDVLLFATAVPLQPMDWGDVRLEVRQDCLLGFYPGLEDGSIDLPADYDGLWDWALARTGEGRVHCVMGGVAIRRLTEAWLQISYGGQGDFCDLAGRYLNVFPTTTAAERMTVGGLKRAWR